MAMAYRHDERKYPENPTPRILDDRRRLVTATPARHPRTSTVEVDRVDVWNIPMPCGRKFRSKSEPLNPSTLLQDDPKDEWQDYEDEYANDGYTWFPCSRDCVDDRTGTVGYHTKTDLEIWAAYKSGAEPMRPYGDGVRPVGAKKTAMKLDEAMIRDRIRDRIKDAYGASSSGLHRGVVPDATAQQIAQEMGVSVRTVWTVLSDTGFAAHGAWIPQADMAAVLEAYEDHKKTQASMAS